MLPDITFLRRPKISAGTIKAAIFLLLVAVALGFWFYTQAIFEHIRLFQKSVVKTHVRIYAKIIDPASTYDSELLELFEPVVMQAPYPSVFTDAELNPIQGLWHNVGVDPSDTTLVSREKMKKLVKRMDTVNPPERLFIPSLKARSDTLIVFEMPNTMNSPVLITDQSSNYIYSRNVSVDPNDLESMNHVLRMFDLSSKPLSFQRENEPTLVFHGLHGGKSWPMVIIKKNGEPLYWNDVAISSRLTQTQLDERLELIMRDMAMRGIVYTLVTNNIPVQNERLFHYGDLPFLTMIGWLPVIELAAALILLSIGFIGILSIKNAEQRSIWVGMAKETAHQLGTPISSLSGWFELLRTDQSEEMVLEALPELEYDVRRLTRVAARFSNVGSKPELKPIVLTDVIEEVLSYYRSRLPRMGKSVTLESKYTSVRPLMGNTELLNWAFENLVKNSLAAIESNGGTIRFEISMTKDFRDIIVDCIDNGRGIQASLQKKVMQPGFTTKKRGWGLGLSLVKRIIEDYHGGKVFLLESKVGQGTTFRVILPAIKDV